MTRAARAGSTFQLRPTWGGRAKAFGLALLYFLVFGLAIGGGLFALYRTGLLHLEKGHAFAPAEMLLTNGVSAAAAVIAAVLTGLLVREPPARWGFALKYALRDGPIGLGVGLVLLAGLLAAMAAMGGYAFGTLALAPDRIAGWAGLYALIFVLVAVAEETIFRSFVLVQLSRAISFWPAAILLALLFGAAHLHNAGENPLGALSAGLLGLILAYSFRRTGSLWFALGMHASWDYGETFVFGVPDSGVSAPGA